MKRWPIGQKEDANRRDPTEERLPPQLSTSKREEEWEGWDGERQDRINIFHVFWFVRRHRHSRGGLQLSPEPLALFACKFLILTIWEVSTVFIFIYKTGSHFFRKVLGWQGRDSNQRHSAQYPSAVTTGGGGFWQFNSDQDWTPVGVNCVCVDCSHQWDAKPNKETPWTRNTCRNSRTFVWKESWWLSFKEMKNRNGERSLRYNLTWRESETGLRLYFSHEVLPLPCSRMRKQH